VDTVVRTVLNPVVGALHTPTRAFTLVEVGVLIVLTSTDS